MTHIVVLTIREIDERLAATYATDPRVSEEYVRHVTTDAGPIVLVGVVHDHPSSIYRVEAIIDEMDPGLVAVELPDLLVPSFAAAIEAGDSVGGEMSAAIRASHAPVLGIDLPSWSAGSAVVAAISANDPGLSTITRTIRSIGRMLGHTALGRLASLGVPGLPTIRDLEHNHVYDIPDDASPAVQADHEATHLDRSTTLLRAFEPPPATRLMDAIREQHMADKLWTMRQEESIVAVVGYSHLDGIVAALRDEPE